jgi:hypothetical protein
MIVARLQHPEGPPHPEHEAASAAPEPPSVSDLVAKLKVARLDWHRGGFGTVAIIDRLVIENDNAIPVHDVQLSCVTRAPSGTDLDSLSPIIYRVFPAGKKTTATDLNLGLINQQAQSLWCSVVYAQPG